MSTVAPPASDGARSQTSRSRLIGNALYSAVAYVIYLPVSLAVNAYMVHRIGLTAFGIWALLTTIAGYGSLLDFGITTPLVKYVAESVALDRPEDVNELVNTAMAFYLVVGAVFAIGMSLATSWILVHIFHVAANDATLRLLYLATVFSFVGTLTFSVLESLLIGLQRVDVVSRLTLGYNLTLSAGFVVVLSRGLAVNGLVAVWVTVNALTVGANWFVARRLFPRLVINPFRFRLTRLRRIMGFSTRVQVTSMTLALNDRLDGTLIAYALGPAMAGSYQLASRAAGALRGVSYALMAGLLPASADLSAGGDAERLRQLYLRATRYITVIDLALCLGAAALARPLITAWLGGGHDRVAWTMVIIVAVYAVGLPCQATVDMLNGIGRPGIRMRADIVLLCVHAPLSAFLIWRYGYYGTLSGTAAAVISNRVYLYWRGSRALGVGLATLLRRSLLQPLIAAVLAAAAGLLPQLLGAALTLPMLLLEGVLFGVVYVLYIGVFALDHYDRELVRDQLVVGFSGVWRRLRPAS